MPQNNTQLNDDDIVWLTEQIIGTAELLGHDIKPMAAAMLADDLSSYPRRVLAAALSRVRTEYSGRLTPRVILDRIDEAMGRPSANEAWSIAITALDERKTVVWTAEMAQAWGVAHPIAKQGDIVGARMAFISAYERLVRTARDERRLPEVTVSIGWDASLRPQAIERAVGLGYMRPEQAREYLPAPEVDPVFSPVALLSGRVEVSPGAPQDVRDRLRQLRDDLANSAQRQDADRARAASRAASDLAAKKAAVQRIVDERLRADALVDGVGR